MAPVDPADSETETLSVSGQKKKKKKKLGSHSNVPLVWCTTYVTCVKKVLEKEPPLARKTHFNSLSRTRWVERHQAYETFHELYPHVVRALEIMSSGTLKASHQPKGSWQESLPSSLLSPPWQPWRSCPSSSQLAWSFRRVLAISSRPMPWLKLFWQSWRRSMTRWTQPLLHGLRSVGSCVPLSMWNLQSNELWDVRGTGAMSHTATLKSTTGGLYVYHCWTASQSKWLLGLDLCSRRRQVCVALSLLWLLVAAVSVESMIWYSSGRQTYHALELSTSKWPGGSANGMGCWSHQTACRLRCRLAMRTAFQMWRLSYAWHVPCLSHQWRPNEATVLWSCSRRRTTAQWSRGDWPIHQSWRFIMGNKSILVLPWIPLLLQTRIGWALSRLLAVGRYCLSLIPEIVHVDLVGASHHDAM